MAHSMSKINLPKSEISKAKVEEVLTICQEVKDLLVTTSAKLSAKRKSDSSSTVDTD